MTKLRRALGLLLACAFALAPAPARGQGNVAPNPNPVRIDGPLTLRATGVNPSVGARAALQGYLNRAAALYATANVGSDGAVPIVTLIIPAANNPYVLDGALRVPPGAVIDIRGEGSVGGGTHLVMDAGHGNNCVYIGMPGDNDFGGGTAVPDAGYRPDLWNGGSPKLDSSAIGGPNQRWGWRTHGDLEGVMHGGPFSHGPFSDTTHNPDNWVDVQQLTLEIALEGFASGQVPAGVICGIGSPAAPYPFQLWSNGSGSFTLYFATQPGRLAAPTAGSITASVGAATGVVRLVFEIDTAAGVGRAFSGTSTTNTPLTVTGSVPSGVFLAENPKYPFLVNGLGDVNPGGGIDFALYGLCLSRSMRYTALGARADAGTISDAYRYFPINFPSSIEDLKSIGFLPFKENPSTAPRLVTLMGGKLANNYQPCDCWLFNAGTLDGPGGLASGVQLNDITVSAAQYGAAISMGHALACQFRGVTAYGGLWGIATSPYVANNYTHLFENCVLKGTDASMYLDGSVFYALGININVTGKYAFRLSGCADTFERVFVTSVGNPAYGFAYFHGGTYSAIHNWKHVVVDQESGFFLGSTLTVEAAAYTGSTVNIDDFLVSGASAGDYLLDLIGFGTTTLGSANRPSLINVRTLQGVTNKGLIRVDGDAFGGEVRDCAWTAGPVLTNTGALGGRPRLRYVDTSARTPRRGLSVIAGTEIYEQGGAADGQPRRIVALTGGTGGSATPPRFGFDGVLASDPAATLAGYAADHTQIACTLSGHASSAGFWSETASIWYETLLFGGTPSTTPTSFQVCLKTSAASRNSFVNVRGTSVGVFEPDPTSTAYARQPLTNNTTNFPAASGGSKASGTTVTFPAATAAYTVYAVALVDDAGNNWCEIQLAAPLSVGIGQTPTISSGNLTFARTPFVAPFGGPTAYGWGKMVDAAFGSVSFTAPGTWKLALSTVAYAAATTSPTEPVGNGYAQASVTNDAAHWFVDGTAPSCDVGNAQAIAFASPTGGAWGTVLTAWLGDGSGHWLFQAPLTIPITTIAGDPPTFQVGALTLSF
jgi:hypothetical protein